MPAEEPDCVNGPPIRPPNREWLEEKLGFPLEEHALRKFLAEKKKEREEQALVAAAFPPANRSWLRYPLWTSSAMILDPNQAGVFLRIMVAQSRRLLELCKQRKHAACVQHFAKARARLKVC